ncbi:MAG: lipopolysaccharide transport periplasmic protein LptA [Desulfurivibrionaceae bacterium]
MKLFYKEVSSILLVIFYLASYPAPQDVLARNGQEAPTAEQQPGEAESGENKWNMSQPVHIEADRMASDQRKDVVDFFGSVVAVQGPLTINSEKMTVHHDGSGPGASDAGAAAGNQEIERIVATGEVKLSRGDLTAVGDKMIFEIRKEKIFIKGNAKVWHQDNLVQGEDVVFDLTEGTTVFESGGKENTRVKAFFSQEEE